MAKRFVDTEIWKKSWFRTLNPKMKCAWIYLCTACDYVGVWEVDLETMSHFVGQRISLEEITENFKVVPFGEDKLFIPSFIAFQYGDLDDESSMHLSVVRKLKAHGLWDDISNSYITVASQSPQGAVTLQVKEKEKVKEEEKEKAKDKERPTKADFLRVYKESYPRKEGRDKGIERCQFQIKNWQDFELFEKAVKKYASICERDGIVKKYQKHFSTFMSNWREVLDDDYGQTMVAPPASNQTPLLERLKAIEKGEASA